MARSFSSREKAVIRGRIAAAGRAHFARQGLRKTSIEDLTRSAGIAKSSFYIFFGSKEQLYLELLAAEGPAAEARVRAAVRAAASRREGVRALLRSAIREVEVNPLTRRMLSHPEELEMVAASATPAQLAESGRTALAIIEPYLREGQAAAEVIPGDPNLLARAMTAVTLLTLHRSDIGDERYDAVMETLVDLVARALVPEEER